MWLQLAPDVVERLAVLADSAKMADTVHRLRHFLSLHADEANELSTFREAVRNQFSKEGELEIDDDAIVSQGEDNGAYVMAWQWVAE